jgi:hypothetical protein
LTICFNNLIGKESEKSPPDRSQRTIKISISMAKTQTLLLGWQANNQGDPQCWLGDNFTGHIPDKKHLTEIDAELLASNSAIIAQSGSGKSFFLGRLIEELLLQTKAKVLVLDPNSDFRLVTQSVDKKKWDNPHYDIATRKGWLPTEHSPEPFLSRWKKLQLRIDSNVALQSDVTIVTPHFLKRISIPWRSLPAEYIANEAGSFSDADVSLCHGLFDRIIKFIQAKAITPGPTDKEIVSMVNALYNSKVYDDIFQSQSLRESKYWQNFGSSEFIPSELKHAFYLKQLVNPDCLRQYVALATAASTSGIFTFAPSASHNDDRLRVLDLASLLEKDNQRALVSTTLRDVWETMHEKWRKAMDEAPEEDQRSPLFIVVDEAHHVIPREPMDRLQKLLVNQFRQIATEGRKYGVFLIIVTQRPDRLDTIVAGECMNIAAMRMNSQKAIDEAVNVFSLDGPMEDTLRKVRSFAPGRVALLGGWAGDTPKLLYSAGRRTQEGGRNIRAEFWAARK